MCLLQSTFVVVKSFGLWLKPSFADDEVSGLRADLQSRNKQSEIALSHHFQTRPAREVSKRMMGKIILLLCVYINIYT